MVLNTLTDSQREILGDIDDVAEHVAFEFDPNQYAGIGTCGFAWISNIDGRCSFVRRCRSLADSDATDVVTFDRNNNMVIDCGQLEMLLQTDYSGGYCLSVTNVRDIIGGPSHQRIDAREAINSLVKERLQYNGYIPDARVKSRMD